MSDPRRYVSISIYNKKLYTFLLEYAKKGCFRRDNLIRTSGSSSCPYPKENLSSIMCDNTDDQDYRIEIFDPFLGNGSCVPEGVYDIVPCLLIYLSYMFRWDQGDHDSFSVFRQDLLSKKADIEKHFDIVLWEVEWIDNRYSWDGIYKWTEKFSYNRFEDNSKHTKTVYKLGLDLEDDLKNRPMDDNEKSRVINAIKERSKYFDYDWNSLSYAGDKMESFPTL